MRFELRPRGSLKIILEGSATTYRITIPKCPPRNRRFTTQINPAPPCRNQQPKPLDFQNKSSGRDPIVDVRSKHTQTPYSRSLLFEYIFQSNPKKPSYGSIVPRPKPVLGSQPRFPHASAPHQMANLGIVSLDDVVSTSKSV